MITLIDRLRCPGRPGGQAGLTGELIEHCAEVTCLRLNIDAAVGALHLARPLSDRADEVRDIHRRLDTLTIGEATADIRAVFSWSYEVLAPESARMFRLLGVHPGPDISLAAAASLAVVELDDARGALGDLAAAHLIAEHAPGRYTFHDLLRAYAADLVHTHESAAEGQRDRGSSAYAISTCTPPAPPTGFSPRTGRSFRSTHPHPACTRTRWPTTRLALAWFDVELPNLLAVRRRRSPASGTRPCGNLRGR